MSENKDEHKNDYVTIVEVINKGEDGNPITRTMNLYSSTPAGAFVNTMQVEQLYKTSQETEVRLIGTYSKTSFAVVDLNKYKGELK